MSCESEQIVKHNLEFNLLFPLFKTPLDSLARFHNVHDYLGKNSAIIDKATHRKLLHECDYILNLLEDF